MSTTAFKMIQIARQGVGTPETSLAAERQIGGTVTVTPVIDWHRPMDDNGKLSEHERSIIVGKRSILRYEGDAIYEELHHWFGMALKGAVAPTRPGTGLTYVWTFTPSLTTLNAQDTYMFEVGDNTEEWDVDGVVCTDLELNYTPDEVVSLRAGLEGRFPVQGGSFTTLAEPSVSGAIEIVSNDTTIWIDSTWANLGTSAISATIASMTVKFPTGISRAKFLSGALSTPFESQEQVEGKRHFEIEMELIMGTNGLAQYNAWKADTARAIRIKTTHGTVIDGNGSPDLQIDMIGRFTSNPELFGDRNGQTTIRLTFSSFHDGLGNECSVIVTNANASDAVV